MRWRSGCLVADDRCYVCRVAVPLGGALFVAGVEAEEVCFCAVCAAAFFPDVVGGMLSGVHCAACGVARDSMN